jgi:hypothetical protein
MWRLLFYVSKLVAIVCGGVRNNCAIIYWSLMCNCEIMKMGSESISKGLIITHPPTWVIFTQCTHTEFAPVIFGYFVCELGRKLHFTAHVAASVELKHKAGWTNFEFVHMVAFSVSLVNVNGKLPPTFFDSAIKTCCERLQQLPIFSSSSGEKRARRQRSQYVASRLGKVSELVAGARDIKSCFTSPRLEITSKTMEPAKEPDESVKNDKSESSVVLLWSCPLPTLVSNLDSPACGRVTYGLVIFITRKSV